MNRREWRWLAWACVALLIAGSLPYLIAWVAAPDQTHFTGLVFNPQDGNSYLAKMRQGFNGSWRFHLAFTPEPGSGAPIFLFHLWLGHVARWTNLPLVAVYHGARILGGAATLTPIYALASNLSDRREERGTMFLLTSLGSGLGWLLGPIGAGTADLWVPEAFPAYSLMANAHFPLAIGLMAVIALCGLRIVDAERRAEGPGGTEWLTGSGMTLAAVLLGAIQPFGLVPVFGGLAAMLTARALRDRSVPWRAGVWIGGAAAVALIYPLYMQLVIHSDPTLSAWNAQNTTSSPPLWDWAASYGLVLVLALLGGGFALRRGSNGDFLALGWALTTLIGMYLPLALQRRLALGLGVPLGLLAGMGWWRTVRPRIAARGRTLMQGLAVAFSALTPIFLIVVTSSAALSGEPWFYLSDGEWASLKWLRDEARSGAVVLSAPQTGSFVPAWTGQTVVYGHPFETVNAARRKAQVEAYWTGEMSDSQREAFLEENRVSYVLVGPRERALGGGESKSGAVGELAFEADQVGIYTVDGR